MRTRLPAILAAAVLTGSLTSCSSPTPVSADHMLTQTPESPVTQGVLAPGDPIVIKNGNDYSHCTAGASVNAQGHQGIITAGHCGSAGDPVLIQGEGGRWMQVSTVARSTFNPATGIDAAFIPLAGGQGTQHVRSASVTTNSGLIRGTKVCSLGVVSGYRCGSVLTVAANRVLVDFPSAHGDSGGPVWAGGQVVGIVRAIAGDQPNTTVVFPIAEAMRAVGAS